MTVTYCMYRLKKSNVSWKLPSLFGLYRAWSKAWKAIFLFRNWVLICFINALCSFAPASKIAWIQNEEVSSHNTTKVNCFWNDTVSICLTYWCFNKCATNYSNSLMNISITITCSLRLRTLVIKEWWKYKMPLNMDGIVQGSSVSVTYGRQLEYLDYDNIDSLTLCQKSRKDDIHQ